VFVQRVRSIGFDVFFRLGVRHTGLLRVMTGMVTVMASATWMSAAAVAQTGVTGASVQAAPAAAVVEDNRYRIGPGDVLTIYVRKSPELSMEAVRVDQRGMIRMPMIEDEIQAACHTETELANQIGTLYLEYKKNPSVQVFVKEFQSQPVAVIGAVNSPGQFRLQRQIHLLELLSFAGGPSEKAGRVINVIHAGGPNVCDKAAASQINGQQIQGLGIYKLAETLKGREGSNPLVRPGDIIEIAEADMVYVVGHVISPRAIALQDKPITLSRAIAMAGGPQPTGKTDRIRIVRQMGEGETKTEIYVNLKAIESQQAEDIALLPNDIVEVGSSTGKTILGILTGAISPAISSGVVRAIPGVP
jgi:polysaccharide biosynthesis/export protein